MEKKKRTLIEPSETGEITPERMRKVVRSIHVVPDVQGGWSVQGSGTHRAMTHFSNKKDAVSYGREASRRMQRGLYVHDRNGEVQEVRHYGDPPPPCDYAHEGEQ